MMGISIQLILVVCIVYFGSTFVQPYSQIVDQTSTNHANDGSEINDKVFNNLFGSIAKSDREKSEIFRKTLEHGASRGKQVFDTMKGELMSARKMNVLKRGDSFKKKAMDNIMVKKRETETPNRMDAIGSSQEYKYQDKERRGEIFKFNIQKPNFYVTPQYDAYDDSKSTTPRRRTDSDPELLYRHGIWDGIQLFHAQDRQINKTREHLVNVWGAGDEGVKRMLAKLGSMEIFVNQKSDQLVDKLEGEITQSERSIKPFDWITLDILAKDWKEIERFIEGKCAEKKLTKAQQDELYALREWLKFSDQELAIPYDTMKERMEKIMALQSARRR